MLCGVSPNIKTAHRFVVFDSVYRDRLRSREELIFIALLLSRKEKNKRHPLKFSIGTDRHVGAAREMNRNSRWSGGGRYTLHGNTHLVGILKEVRRTFT